MPPVSCQLRVFRVGATGEREVRPLAGCSSWGDEVFGVEGTVPTGEPGDEPDGDAGVDALVGGAVGGPAGRLSFSRTCACVNGSCAEVSPW